MRLVSGGEDGMVSAVAYRPDGQLMATASSDGTAKLWDARNQGLDGDFL